MDNLERMPWRADPDSGRARDLHAAPGRVRLVLRVRQSGFLGRLL